MDERGVGHSAWWVTLPGGSHGLIAKGMKDEVKTPKGYPTSIWGPDEPILISSIKPTFYFLLEYLV